MIFPDHPTSVFVQVLTAAHCVGGIPGKEDRWGIEMGAHNLMSRGSAQQYSPVKRAIKHPEYNPKNLHADHALIELTRPFKMTDRVTLGCLPDAGSQVSVGTQECYIAGQIFVVIFVVFH